MRSYWLIERNQLHGEPSAKWFSQRVHTAGGSRDLWVQDVSRAEKFDTKDDAEESISRRFVEDVRYPVLPVATDHVDVGMPTYDDLVKQRNELRAKNIELVRLPTQSEMAELVALRAKNAELLAAAETGAKWMEWWLDNDCCDCEGGHKCGRPERKAELAKMQQAIAKAGGEV